MSERTFGVSDRHTGPWLGEDDTPAKALAKGRAMWGPEKKLYVAEIRLMEPSEALPPVEVLVSDMKEKLVEKYGSGADEIFDNKKVMIALKVFWEQAVRSEFDRVIDGVADMDFMVTTAPKLYSPGNEVKVGDFK